MNPLNFFRRLWNWMFQRETEEPDPFFLFESDRDFDKDAEIITDTLPPVT